MVHQAKASHIGSCLSAADLIAVLYSSILKINPGKPQDAGRDRFILSKGHAAAILYAALAEHGFFPKENLSHYCQDGQALSGHATSGVPGVELSTGSLGHGLSVGCGLALGSKRMGLGFKTYVLLSDGECDEGSVWESALFAPHHRLNNLVAIIDYNKIQSFGSVKEVLNLEPLAKKWEAFGWRVHEINGHSHAEILKALQAASNEPDQPTCIVAHTVKGKGVRSMENLLAWHYKSPSDSELQQAILDVEQGDFA